MKSAASPQVSIIVPTYNEKENVAILIEEMHRVISGKIEYEAIIVDDDSPDGTAIAAAALTGRFPVKVLIRKDVRGLASAVVYGIDQSASPVVAVIDADLQHPPQLLLPLIKEIENGADVAIASRYAPGGSIAEWGIGRSITSKVAAFLAKMAVPATRGIADPLSGFFVFNRNIIEGTKLAPIGYKILLEILAVGYYSNVSEIPYRFNIREKGVTKYNSRVLVQYVQHLFTLAWKNGEILRIFKFILVGASGVVINEGLLYVLTYYAGLFYLISSVIAVQVAILNNFFWNHIWTFKDRRIVNEAAIVKLGKFELVSIAGKAMNILVLYIGVTFFDMQYLMANLIGIAAGFVVNFLVNNVWTWRK